MSLFYNNDPFWNFFDNINEEVNNFNTLLNRRRAGGGNKQLTNNNNDNNNNGSKEVSKRDNNRSTSLSPWSNDLFGLNNSLFKFADDVDIVPPVDIIDNDKDYDLHVSIPGAPKENITIDFNKDENQLIIKGTVPSAVQEEEGSNHHIERQSGSFERRVTLPVKVDGDGVKATFENGVLKLKVPKVENGDDKNKYKRIEISSSESYSS